MWLHVTFSKSTQPRHLASRFPKLVPTTTDYTPIVSSSERFPCCAMRAPYKCCRMREERIVSGSADYLIREKHTTDFLRTHILQPIRFPAAIRTFVYGRAKHMRNLFPCSHERQNLMPSVLSGRSQDAKLTVGKYSHHPYPSHASTEFSSGSMNPMVKTWLMLGNKYGDEQPYASGWKATTSHTQCLGARLY